ncbi:hypothetical protein BWI17_20870 [Betaproteobacteria bacterium GR16-43]|nr:hypothetical protein BWI17_20870 [Betaproteobacteria bacterium GR16-43]
MKKAFALALALAFPLEVLAAVEYVTVRKTTEYSQTSATDVVVNPQPLGPLYGGPYGFAVNVEGTNIAGIPMPTTSGPYNLAAIGSFFNNGKLVYNTGDAAWRLGVNGNDWGSPNKADLDSKFPNGTYTVVVNGQTVAVNLAGDKYPVRPRLILSGGVWANGKYVVDPARPLTLTTDPFAEYGQNVNGVMVIGVEGVGRLVQGRDVTPSPNVQTFTVPAGTFVAGQEYFAGASFQAVVDLKPNAGLPGSYNSARYESNTGITIKAETPIFPMVVTGGIGPTVSTINADIKYRPQDVGSSGSVYTFAVAPQTLVLPALLKSGDTLLPPLGYAKRADGGKADTNVACVLAQLNAAGKLQAVSVSGLQAFVSGVLGSQGQSVAVINGIATVNIAGATFYVGYGSSAQSMINNGVNRNVVAVPGSLECRPQPPQTGWWWNPAEGGRGYSVEVQGNHIFYAAFLYDDAGRSHWLIAAGNVSLDGSLFAGDLLRVTGGQTLGGTYRPNNPAQTVGAITLAFSDASHGTMVWPGGAVPIERMNIVPDGLIAPPRLNQPESGWWWNPNESGRGFFLEWQNGWADIAGYMYDDNGNPVWYLTSVPVPDVQRYVGNWWLFANGQSLTGAYKPPTRINDNVAPMTFTFTSATTATLTLPNGRTTNLVRQRY